MTSTHIRQLFRGFFKSKAVVCLLVGLSVGCGIAETAPALRELKDIAYKSGAALTEYETARCKLDLYLPAATSNFATLVWFHGGGLTGGSKDEAFTKKIARSFAQGPVAVAAVNYRLSPAAKYPAYIEDAAAAVAWIHTNIARHGGDSGKVFVGGHSAGGYLTAMVGLDARYLQPHGLQPDAIAGLIPISGQTMTHYTIREERRLPKSAVFADDAAPVHHAANATPPWLVLFADHDMPARAEENLYFVALLKAAGNQRVKTLEIAGRDHGSIAGNIAQPDDPARLAILAFIEEVSRTRAPAKPSR